MHSQYSCMNILKKNVELVADIRRYMNIYFNWKFKNFRDRRCSFFVSFSFTGRMGQCHETAFRCKLNSCSWLFDFHYEWIKFWKIQHLQRLTAAEKERYKQKAKELPNRVVFLQPKYTSQGVSLEQVEREQRELFEKKRYMERKIKNLVENGFLNNGNYSKCRKWN